jgi:hypothetical protein
MRLALAINAAPGTSRHHPFTLPALLVKVAQGEPAVSSSLVYAQLVSDEPLARRRYGSADPLLSALSALSNNYARGGNGGNGGTGSGGGIYVGPGSVTLHNTLISGNPAGSNPSDVVGSLDSASDYNLIGDGSGGLSTANHNLLGSSSSPLNPLLAPLGNYGGPTQTMALLPGSPAIGAGSSTSRGSTDQRGNSRVGATDIGAFESQGFSIAVSSGNYQSALVNTAFAQPLVVSVTANNAAEPVTGGLITFTAPASGASAVLSGSPAIIGSDGRASVTATANGTAGTYTVTQRHWRHGQD